MLGAFIVCFRSEWGKMFACVLVNESVFPKDWFAFVGQQLEVCLKVQFHFIKTQNDLFSC